MARSDTLFCLRYASVVLERHAALYRKLDALFRFLSVISGSGAIFAMTSSSPGFLVVSGVVFAIAQALELSVRPGEVAACSLAIRREYARLRARGEKEKLSDGALEAEYRALVAEDEIRICEPLRHLAYNDVVQEQGDEEKHLYAASCTMRALASIT